MYDIGIGVSRISLYLPLDAFFVLDGVPLSWSWDKDTYIHPNVSSFDSFMTQTTTTVPSQAM